MKVTEIRGSVTSEQTEQIAGAFASAFGPKFSLSPDFEGRLNEKRELSVLVAQSNELVGFKIGYERYRGIFFSWLGGVIENSRRKGIARELLRQQHHLCLERGYSEIQTEASGDGKAMLLLNIQEGFEVYGTYLGADGGLRVQLRKFLVPNKSEQIGDANSVRS